jgi:oligoendopeptidase F
MSNELSRPTADQLAKQAFQQELIKGIGAQWGNVSPAKLIEFLRKREDPTGQCKVAAFFLEGAMDAAGEQKKLADFWRGELHKHANAAKQLATLHQEFEGLEEEYKQYRLDHPARLSWRLFWRLLRESLL